MKKQIVLLLTVLAVLFVAVPVWAGSEEIVSIQGEKWEIPATICMPDGNGPFPLVIMYHGTASSRDEAGGGYKMLAPKLADAGIASVRFDFVGNGDSKGDYKDYTLTSAYKDGESVIDYMLKNDKIDSKRIGVLGWSQGGTIAMLTAGRDSRVKSMVTWAGAVDMSSYLADKYDEAKKNGFARVEFDWRTPLNFSLAWFDEVRSTDVAKELSNYKGAALAMAGTKDTTVPLTDLDKIVAACKGSPVKKELIDGADHTFNVFTGDLTAYNKLSDETVKFFTETL